MPDYVHEWCTVAVRACRIRFGIEEYAGHNESLLHIVGVPRFNKNVEEAFQPSQFGVALALSSFQGH